MTVPFSFLPGSVPLILPPDMKFLTHLTEE